MINLSQHKKCFVLLLVMLLTSLPVTAATEAAAGEKVLFAVDFSQQPDGSAIDWLTKNGFILELDAKKLNPRFEDHHLVISTEAKRAGIFILKIYEKMDLTNVDRVDIEWGVSRFPKGMNWEEGNNRVALAVMIFFGTEEISSGLPLNIHAAPYFFSPFLSKLEPPEKMYTGKLYKKGGRYFSVAAPQDSSSIFTTRFEVRQRFQKIFHKKDVPAVSGVAFQMNTENTDGVATASIRRISFIGK